MVQTGNPPHCRERGVVTRYRIIVLIFALVGALLGAAAGFLLAPHPHRYGASANVVLLPPTGLSSAESASFWEVITRGQVTRTAAVVYDDPRWLASAANAASVPQSQLALTVGALPDTTMLTATMSADSPAAAEAALNDLLTAATPEVGSLVVPFVVKVLWPPRGSAKPLPLPSRVQVAAAGALGGLLLVSGIGWGVVLYRNRAGGVDSAADRADDDSAQALR
jgi:hypothetical protein